MLNPGEKNRLILSEGRFFAGGHPEKSVPGKQMRGREWVVHPLARPLSATPRTLPYPQQ